MEKSKVFVIMPFSDDFFESYEMLKEHFQDDFELPIVISITQGFTSILKAKS